MLKSFAAGALFGRRFGDGHPQVLAMHGWGRDHRDFAEILQGLDAIAIDLPGFGASPEPNETLDSAGYAKLVTPVLDEFHEPAVLVGHSFGGRVAVELAVAHPDRVAALVLVGVPLLRRSGPARHPPIAYRLIRALHRAGLVGDDRMEQARQTHGSADYQAARGVMREVLVKVVNESYEQQLAVVRQPAHLVWGADDADVPTEVAERALAYLGGGQLTVLEGVGHHVCLEAPEAVRAAVLGVVS
jgi:pimeloyl-ACP methyl ester carboxylesterase